MVSRLFLVAAFSLLIVTCALADGTPAGTDITSQATINYTITGTGYTELSNTVTTSVAEVLDLSLVWQDAAPVEVQPGTVAQALAFRLTNTGNGSDGYNLAGQSTLGGDDFDPVLGNIHLDTNGNGRFDPGLDELYIPGGNDPVLAADAFTLLFLLNDIPSNATVNQLGASMLSAASNTGVGAPGTVFTGAGENGLDAVVGTNGGQGDGQGSYRIVALSAQVAILKSAVVVDPFGGSQPVAGATITYQLSVIATGTGSTNGVVVSDAIPLNTSYNPGTLMLDGTPVTDAVDGDQGDMGGTTPGAITVSLGDVAVGGPGKTITFTVTID
ncbi:MAG: hypothetical protein DRP71_09000 [Verrucomicrobia bacterium]|nr:MAG: hypothetical protein DRP71_09000 [Verrucomicrobiota bacterium]